MLLDGQKTRGVRLPLDLEPGRLENLDDRIRYLGTDTVSGDQRDGVFHKCLPPTAYRLPPTAYCLLPTAYCLPPTAPSLPNTAAQAHRGC